MAENITTEIYKGDDTGAFGRQYIKINAPVGVDSSLISKIVFQCGNVQKEILTPKFPCYVNFSSEETKLFTYRNDCYLQIFDSEDRKITLKGNLTVLANKQVVNDCSTCSEEEHNYA